MSTLLSDRRLAAVMNREKGLGAGVRICGSQQESARGVLLPLDFIPGQRILSSQVKLRYSVSPEAWQKAPFEGDIPLFFSGGKPARLGGRAKCMKTICFS